VQWTNQPCNTCISSHYLEWSLAPNPVGKRAYRIALNSGYNADKSVEYLCYGTSIYAVLVPLDNPGKPVIFMGHKNPVTCVAIAPNGQLVASGDDKGTVIVWNLDAKQEIVNTFSVCDGAVNDIRWGPKSDMFVAGGSGRRVYATVFRTRSLNAVGKIDKITTNVLSVDFAPAGDLVATADESNDINFYPKFEHGARTKNHKRYPNIIRFSPDGSVLASASSDSTVILTDAKTYEVKQTFGGPECKDGHSGSIYSLAWSPCGKKFATAAADSTVKVWNAEDGSVLKTWTVNSSSNEMQNQLCAVTWTPSGRIVTLSVGSVLDVFEEGNDNAVKRIISPSTDSVVSAITVSRTTGNVYSVDLAGRVSEIESKSGATSWLPFTVTNPTGVAVSCDGKTLYISASETIYAANLESKSMSPLVTLDKTVLKIVASSSKPGLIAVAFNNESVGLVNEGKLAGTAQANAADLAFNADDSELAVALVGLRCVRVFTVSADGALTFKHDSADDNNSPLSFVTYFKDWIIANQGNQLNIYTPAKWPAIANPGWTFHESPITSGALNPAGTLLLTVAKDRQIIIWRELDKLRPRNKIVQRCSPGGLTRVAWINDAMFITVDDSQFVACWSVL